MPVDEAQKVSRKGGRLPITGYWNGQNYEIRCHGDSLGFADITVAGGLSPYTYTALDINNNYIF